MSRRFQFSDGTMVVDGPGTMMVYDDGATAPFYPPVQDRKYRAIARRFGYVDPWQYGVEHELAHAFLTTRGLFWEHSKVLWSAAHKDWTIWPLSDCWAEEHVVNRFQKFVNTGKVDTDYGVLLSEFGWLRLTDLAAEFCREIRWRIG